MAYAVETCPGWSQEYDSSDALGQRRCCVCGWSWDAHRWYRRPHPERRPEDFDTDDPAWMALWEDEA